MIPGIEHLRSYVSDLLSDRNTKEEVKRQRFLHLLSVLFPSESDAIAKYVGGTEKTVHIKDRLGAGRIDAYYGNLVIEFERNLRKSDKFDEGYLQLRSYVAALWNEEKDQKRNYICLLSDGVEWYTYFPRLVSQAQNLREADVELLPKEHLDLSGASDANLEDFYHYVDRLFFRENRVKPTLEAFRRDFGLNGYLYESAGDAISRVFAECKATPEVANAFSQWARYLTYTYGSIQANEQLFCRHSYLTVLARLIVAAALFPEETSHGDRKLLHELFDGTFFVRKGILNLVDDDFFHWLSLPDPATKLERTWLMVLQQLNTYDFSEIGEDILKGVYQELVDPKDRHDLGEYYTPDWLCEWVVEHTLAQRRREIGRGRIPAMLDPACGSGGFLRAGIRGLRNLISEQGDSFVDWNTFLSNVVSNVVGMDIHPLAVTIAKATYVLALKDALDQRTSPIHIPVYLADSLFMPREKGGEAELWEDAESFQTVRFQGVAYPFPTNLFGNASHYDIVIRLAADVAENLVENNSGESIESIRNSLNRDLSSLDAETLNHVSHSTWRLAEHLAEKIRQEEDTIWSFILRNSYRPVFFNQKFDIVIGNPPWLSYRYIDDPEYQAEVKRLAIDEYEVAPRAQKLMTQMELATVFLVHSTHTFLRKDGVVGFVMPRSIFSAYQHERFREESWSAMCDITEYWDLRDVDPLFNVPTCVVFARHKKSKAYKTYKARFVSGRLTSRDSNLESAKPALTDEWGRLYRARLGNRTAITRRRIRALEDSPVDAETYGDRFFQGATIVPRNFYFIAPPSPAELQSTEIYARTDPEQAKEAKEPWKSVYLEGRIETDFIYRTALSKHVLPFYLRKDLPYVVLPVVRDDQGFVLKDHNELTTLGFRNAGHWFKAAGDYWQRHRAAKAQAMSILERLDYQRTLMSQNPIADTIVLYNTSGTNISSAVVRTNDIDRPFWVDSTTYWHIPRSEIEAWYLCGILNSQAVNEVIKPFQAAGNLGERHVHKIVLQVPFEFFDPDKEQHHQIADLALSASAKVAENVESNVSSAGIARLRTEARNAASKELKRINQLVKKQLGMR